MQALADMNIDTPTPIQTQALGPLLDEYDLIGQAPTGSGKTLAFSIPLIEFVSPRKRQVQALILTPTRELAAQVAGVLEVLGRGCGIRTVQVIGGRSIESQRRDLARGAHVVVGAPGRVLDMLRRGFMNLDSVHYLVLDEADEMLDRGFAPDVERILGYLKKAPQTALFSATVPDWVQKTAARHTTNAVKVSVGGGSKGLTNIEHLAFDVADGGKLQALRGLLDDRGEGSTVVFGRTKHGVKKLGKQLERLGYPVAALQGNLSQNARDRVMTDFRSGAMPILLATNVAARGLDVDSVHMVINYELPETSELLTHRIGRTGRMGRQGRAITLLAPQDAEKWNKLQRGLSSRIPRQAWKPLEQVG
jgi:ATP-dependent RNA helicase DeaD